MLHARQHLFRQFVEFGLDHPDMYQQQVPLCLGLGVANEGNMLFADATSTHLGRQADGPNNCRLLAQRADKCKHRGIWGI